MFSAKEEILNELQNSDGLTTREAQLLFGITNVRARIHELRKEGHVIYTNKIKSNGRKVNVYRLGHPSKRYMQALRNGRKAAALRSLYDIRKSA